jgi:AbrB family looped-hinge helix DNA binding protein
MLLGTVACERADRYVAAMCEEEVMTLIRLLRGGQVTLPAEVRQRLRLVQGDYLEAEVFDNGLLLRPVSVEEAWKHIIEAPRSVRYTGPKPRSTPEAEEEWLAEEVKIARLEERVKRRR